MTRGVVGYWTKLANQRAFFDQLCADRNICSQEQLYSVSKFEIVRRGGTKILKQYNNSIWNTLKSVYPEKEWDPLKFSHAPQRYWNDKCNQKQLLEKISKELGITELQDWYHVTAGDIARLGGSALLVRHSTCVISILKAHYPDYPWDIMRFRHLPKGSSSSLISQQQILLRLGDQLGVRDYTDWYNVTTLHLKKLRGGSTLLAKYGGSLFKLLSSVLPQHSWDPLKFHVNHNHWKLLSNQRAFLEHVATKLNVHTLQDWKYVTVRDICAFKGGHGLLSRYKYSLPQLLFAVYPQQQVGWDTKKPKGFWENETSTPYVFECP